MMAVPDPDRGDIPPLFIVNLSVPLRALYPYRS